MNSCRRSSIEPSRNLLFFHLIYFLFSPTAPIRLVNGANKCQGRVELLHNGRWGTVCDDDWSLKNAKVVCRQLGCGQALKATTDAHFGAGSGPIWLDNVVCKGDEPYLPRCQNLGFEVHNCGHNEDAGVICEGKILTIHTSILGYNDGQILCYSDSYLLLDLSLCKDGNLSLTQMFIGEKKMSLKKQKKTMINWINCCWIRCSCLNVSFCSDVF